MSENKVTITIAADQEILDLIECRLSQIKDEDGIDLSRSAYLSMLVRKDAKHKSD